MGIPCFLGGMARGMLGKSSPFQFRQCRKDALKEADLVILAGTVTVILDSSLIVRFSLHASAYQWSLFPTCKWTIYCFSKPNAWT